MKGEIYKGLYYCNSYRLFDEDSIHDGSFYYSQIFHTAAEFDQQFHKHNETLRHWTAFLQQLHYSACFTGDSSNRTVSGRLQHITQDRTLQQSTSLPTNTGPQDRSAQPSEFLASADPTALAACSNTNVFLTCPSLT
jgi:hypothetical protein